MLEVLQSDKKILSIYTVAGFPKLNDTLPILKALQDSGVDMIELG
ncbi:MAG: Tryptophan synthase alpha chain, partial [Bacteroidota bacterium]